MDTQKKTFHCKTTTEQELTGKKILQNCRNQLYLDFPYLDGAFTSLEYKADSSIDTIGTDGELIYFNPVFLMKKYLEERKIPEGDWITGFGWDQELYPNSV